MIPTPADAVLLDTCAVIWLANDDFLQPQAAAAIKQAASAGGVLISPISAWEIGLLSRPRGQRQALQFLPDVQSWFATLIAKKGVKTAKFTPDIAIAASNLPGDLHADPADRFLIATARNLLVPIVTRDSKITRYGQEGFVNVLPC